MEEIHSRKSKHKRKHSHDDNDETCIALHESGRDAPKTKKKKISKTISTDPLHPEIESGDVSQVTTQKKVFHNKDKASEVEDNIPEVQEADNTKITKKKKSKKKDKEKENSAVDHGSNETISQNDGLDSQKSKGRQVNRGPDERLEIQKQGDTEVKEKKKSKRKRKDMEPVRLNETTPKKSQTASPDGVENCDEKSKTRPGEMGGSNIETTEKRKLKKKKTKDKFKSSLGAVDSELVESTAKSLKINRVDVVNPDSSKEADTKKKVSTKKRKKKKKKKTEKTGGIDEDLKKSDQNPVSRNERALNYLRSWNLNKASWKFNKMNQVQLFQMMYDASLVKDDDFQILLLYLAGMKGHAKDMTHNQAMKLVEGDADNVAEVSKVKEQRAREIVQVLS